MKDYHKLENELFARWEAKWNSEDPKIQKLHRLEGGDYCKCRKVVRDGMMYRGRIKFYPDGECERQSGDEYKRWEKAPLRLIMLTKDNIDDWDKRSETACDTQEQYDKLDACLPWFLRELYSLDILYAHARNERRTLDS